MFHDCNDNRFILFTILETQLSQIGAEICLPSSCLFFGLIQTDLSRRKNELTCRLLGQELKDEQYMEHYVEH